MNDQVLIHSSDFWVKVVEMLQQNWALIEADGVDSVRVYFISDRSGVFDEISYPSSSTAREALTKNGFQRFARSSELQSFLLPPSAPYVIDKHPNGFIYSSGRYWQS